MKYLIAGLLMLCAMNVSAQEIVLEFNKRFVESEDHWVAFPMDEDSTFHFGFIYIDADAGLTYDSKGSFRIEKGGVFVPVRQLDSVSIKARLEPNNRKVAFIPDSKLRELKVPLVPEWLKYYKTDTGSVQRLYKWGFMYNGWGECEKALTYLEQAKQKDAHYKGLDVELAFSYNCLGQYEKALPYLETVLQQQPDDAYANKEFVYTLVKTEQLDKAAEAINQAIKVCKDPSYNGEMCFNLLSHYYSKKDKAHFEDWLKTAQQWNKDNKDILKYIDAMNHKLSEK